jgi:hypothetical protein
LSTAAEKKPAIEVAAPAVGTIAAQYRERDRRHIPPQVQLVITIHCPPVPAEGLATYSSIFLAFATTSSTGR